MRILLGCINLNVLGGSEMFHYELARELKLAGVDVTLFTLRPTNMQYEVAVSLLQHGVQILDPSTLPTQPPYDIIVASQPEVNEHLLNVYGNTTIPIVSIIHSEIRSEDPVLNPRICHYISIRNPITELLVQGYGIPQEKISLIYNPIDRSRFNNIGSNKLEKTSGIFIGGATDDIRFKSVCYMVDNCIQNDWDLYIMSHPHQRYDFGHPNIKYLDPVWHTEHLVKNMHFTGGILLGRTTLEGWCCGVPGYVFLIDKQGNILDIESTPPDNIIELCDSKYVCNQHLKLYESILQNS